MNVLPGDFVVLKDRINGAAFVFERDSLICMCCADPYTDDDGYGRRNLMLDHTWLDMKRTRYFLLVLCRSCNSRKQGRGFVGHDRRWYPGMPAGTWLGGFPRIA